MIFRSSRSIVLIPLACPFPAAQRTIPQVLRHMRHERLQDVAAASLVVFALLLGPALHVNAAMLQIPGPFLRASPLVFPAVLLLAVLVAPPAEPF